MRLSRRPAALPLLLTLAAALASSPGAARDQDAASRAQTRRSERAQRDAVVPDETSPVSPSINAANPAAASHSDVRSAVPLPPPYGPVLTPRAPLPGAPAANGDAKPSTEVRDETDSRQAAEPKETPLPSKGRQARHHPMRRPAWRPPGPMAPRPLDPAGAPPVPVPMPAPPAPTLTPSSTIAGPCQGGVCTDASGNTMNRASGAAGLDGSGRLCVRGTATVQCF
jgi:hypothetical protein